MSPMRPLLAVLVVLALCGCRGNRITDDGAAGPGAAPAPARDPAGAPEPAVGRGRMPRNASYVAAPGGPGTVSLTGADLAPVDAYLHARNAQWIVGDEIEIVASREYFATALTLNAPWTGIVSKKTEVVGDEEITTMVYRGPKSQASITTNPRALIGTGLTATARKVLRLRMVKTRDADVPVRLAVRATGEASRGVHEKVVERAAAITLGGNLRRRGGGYAWQLLGPAR